MQKQDGVTLRGVEWEATITEKTEEMRAAIGCRGGGKCFICDGRAMVMSNRAAASQKASQWPTEAGFPECAQQKRGLWWIFFSYVFLKVSENSVSSFQRC